MAVTPTPSYGYKDYSGLFSSLLGNQPSAGAPAGEAQPLTSSLQGALGTPTRTPLPPPGATASGIGGGSRPDGIGRELGYAGQALSGVRLLDMTTGSNLDRLLGALASRGMGGGTAGLEGGTGTTAGSALGTTSSLLGLLTAAYNLSQGGDLTPGTALGLAQGSAGLASGAGSLLDIPALAGIGSAGGQVLGAAGIPISLGTAIEGFASDDPRASVGSYGTLAGAGLGALLGGLIGGPPGIVGGLGAGAGLGGTVGNIIGRNLPVPHSMAVRHHFGEVATDLVNNYGFGIQQAGMNGDLSAVQQALGRQFLDGNVRTYLNLPTSVATALGVSRQTDIRDLSPQQFLGLLKAYQEHAGVNRDWFKGVGQVPYQDDQDIGGKIISSMTKTATSAMDQLVKAYAPYLAQMPPIAPLSWEDVGQGYRMAPQLDYGVRAGGAGELQPLTYEQAKGYLGNPALWAGGVQTSVNSPLVLQGDPSVAGALMQLNAPLPGGGTYNMPTEPFASNWQATRGGYQSALDQLSYDAQKQIADLYQRQIYDVQRG